MSPSQPKYALVCDWLLDIGGAESCVGAAVKMFSPEVFALFARDSTVASLGLDPRSVHTSILQRLPKSEKYYRSLLPLYPFAVEQLKVSDADIVLSFSHAVAKGVLTHSEQLHISYMFTPIRYAWDMYWDYLRQNKLESGVKGRFAQYILHKIRQWDLTSVNRVHHFIADSRYVARRIKHYYGRDSEVIYPPVDTDQFSVAPGLHRDDYFVTASRLVPYKRIDLIVDAFSKMPDRKLLVVGDGPQMSALKAKAGKNVEMLGYQSRQELIKYLQNARAFIFAAQEDFGIAPIEAQACGTPVIAYGRGGALETVNEGKTGLFFGEQSVESIVEAVKRFDSASENMLPRQIREWAEGFSRNNYETKLRNFIAAAYERFRNDEQQNGSLHG